MSCRRCPPGYTSCQWCNRPEYLRVAYADEAPDLVVKDESASDLARIVVKWNRNRQARGLANLSREDVLARILKVIREDVEAT